MNTAEGPADDGADPPPPVLGRWSRLYAVVLLVLAATILLMGWVSVRYR